MEIVIGRCDFMIVVSFFLGVGLFLGGCWFLGGVCFGFLGCLGSSPSSNGFKRLFVLFILRFWRINFKMFLVNFKSVLLLIIDVLVSGMIISW